MPHIDKDAVLDAMQGRFIDFYESQGVALKRHGTEFRGPCLLHGGDGANFTVSPSSGFWDCKSQGCGNPGGDVFGFVQQAHGIGFPEALALVGAWAGMAPENGGAERRAPAPQRRSPETTVLPAPPRLLEPSLVAELHRNLLDNEKWLDWLRRERGWTLEVIEGLKIGLLPPKEKGGEWRVTFPVFDAAGGLLNVRKHLFAYRAEYDDARRRELGKTKPWEKGLTAGLFPLSAIQAAAEVLYVEGEADAVLGNVLGLPTVTGTLGAGNLHRHPLEPLRGKCVTILCDNDEAGRKGADKDAAELQSVAAEVRRAQIPDGMGKDLTEWVVGHGATAADVRAAIGAAVPFKLTEAVARSSDRPVSIPVPVPPWPHPDEAMFHGLAGDIVRAVEPHTEADPVAVLFSLILGFGVAIGRSAYCSVGTSRHFGNLFGVICGDTASGKGTSWSLASHMLREADMAWRENRVLTGLSSGEGLIHSVRDPLVKKEPVRDKSKLVVDYQEVVADPGEDDKRLLVVETEFSKTLKVCEREGNTLSPILRQAWDGDNLRVMTKEARSATGAHIGILGHITPMELKRDLTQTDAANGFGNRFLWLCVRRSKLLPEGGELGTVDLAGLGDRLCAAVEFAKGATAVSRDGDAKGVWGEVYPELTAVAPGLLGSMTARAAPNTLRLSMLYALLDGSRVIRRQHLLAALALWEYSKDSVRHLFGDALGDSIADDILRALRERPDGMTRTDTGDLFGRNQNKERIGAALALLHSLGHIRGEKQVTGGRPVERWFAT